MAAKLKILYPPNCPWKQKVNCQSLTGCAAFIYIIAVKQIDSAISPGGLLNLFNL
jgi:hypothetical protein